MGILNVTPDSFSDGGQFIDPEVAIAAAEQMMDDGADLIDVGGESTRPGAEPVEWQVEAERVLPVISRLSALEIPVSIDTMKPEVGELALDAGAFLVNDVSGLRDPAMVDLVQTRQAWVCIMHMLGDPRTMQRSPRYGNVVQEVRDYLVHAANLVRLPVEQIWIDPGIGFGKTVSQNLALIGSLDQFVSTGFPVLLGVSRKSFIGKLLGGEESPLPIEERVTGAIAAQIWAQMQGVRVIRTHEVSASVQAIEMIQALQNGYQKP
jgi:dihydropteroate synthase